MNLVKLIYKLFGDNYWNTRYMLRGGSGYINKNHVDSYTSYVWSIIENHIGKPTDVIDVGCGDLLFWTGRDCDSYYGIDISPTVIAKNKLLRPKWVFWVGSSGTKQYLASETVICVNTLYHIMDDEEYENTIKNLIFWANKNLVIITWNVSPFGVKDTDDFYQKYRDFSLYEKKIIDSGFSLLAKEKIPDYDTSSIWIFRRN